MADFRRLERIDLRGLAWKVLRIMTFSTPPCEIIFVPTSVRGCGKRGWLHEFPASFARWRGLTRFPPSVLRRGGLSPPSFSSLAKGAVFMSQAEQRNDEGRRGGRGQGDRSIFKEIFVDLQRHYRCGARARVNRLLRAYGDAVKGL